MQILSLSESPSAIPVVANWYHTEWGYLHPNTSVADIEADLASHVKDTKLPQAVVMVLDDKAIGAAELKLREVKELTEYEFWLGGVYVDLPYRGKGIGARLALHVASLARTSYGVESLYLQTEKDGGGLYSELGWSEVTRINIGGATRIVMVKELQ